MVIRQVSNGWQLQNRLQQPLHDGLHATREVAEGHALALALATLRGGDVWVWSDVPKRFDRLGAEGAKE